MSPETDPVEDAILTALAAARPGGSIDPAAAAKALDPDGWRGRLKAVRDAAVRLARSGRVVILRKGKPADPDAFKGVYRLRAAEGVSGDVPGGSDA